MESAGDVSAAEAVADFAQRLFGEPFAAEHVVTESYAPLPESLPPLTRQIAAYLADGPLTPHQLAEQLDATPEEIQSALLPDQASPSSN